MLLTCLVQLFNTNHFTSVCFNNMNTRDTSFCQNKSVCWASPENKRPEERRVGNNKLGRNGKTIVRSLCSPVARPKWQWHSQDWCETFPSFCRLKSSLSLKGECAEVAFSVGQDLPCGRGILWEHLCIEQTGKCPVKLTLALKMKKETTVVFWLGPFLMELHHMQTWDFSASLLQHSFAMWENLSSLYNFRHPCLILVSSPPLPYKPIPKHIISLYQVPLNLSLPVT